MRLAEALGLLYGDEEVPEGPAGDELHAALVEGYADFFAARGFLSSGDWAAMTPGERAAAVEAAGGAEPADPVGDALDTLADRLDA